MASEEIDDSNIGELTCEDLVRYFTHTNRSQKCPYCPHDGPWELHVKLDPTTNLPAQDPVLIPFLFGMEGRADNHMRCSPVVCPNCAHVDFISLFKVAKFKRESVSNG